MRVALQIDQLGFRVPGGIGTYVARLLEALPVADPRMELLPFHAPFVRRPTDDAPSSGWGVELATPVRYLYPAWDLLGWPALPPDLRRCGVVHVTNPAGVAPVRRGQALVVTIHDLAFEHFPEAFSWRWLRLYRAGLHAAARRADAILAPSTSTAHDVIARTRVDPSKVHVTPLAALGPVAEDGAGDARLEEHGVRPPYALFVGTIERRKNLVRLVRAYRRIAEDLPHALVLNGPTGWGADEVLREVRSGGAGRIVRTSGLDAATLGALYRHADVFAYPSLYEGFGLPVLEALQHGLPVVAANASSIPEVAGDAALLVDPTDQDALTDALRRALTDPALRADLARRAAAQAARFSWEATARATLAAYRSVDAVPPIDDPDRVRPEERP